MVLQVKALLGNHITKVACGSRDAQTLALSTDGMVFSWGDGDFGKLGRGGSEGCDLPHNIERLNGLGVTHIECGAQFSLALTKSGQVSALTAKLLTGNTSSLLANILTQFYEVNFIR